MFRPFGKCVHRASLRSENYSLKSVENYIKQNEIELNLNIKTSYLQNLNENLRSTKINFKIDLIRMESRDW